MPRRAQVYLLALAAMLAAVALRALLDPLLGDGLPFVTLFGAVAAAVWLGGYRPGLLAALGGYLACDYLFIAPRGELGLEVPENAVGFVAYLFTCGLILGFGEAMRRTRLRANHDRQMLQVTLSSIGDAVLTTDLEGRITSLNPTAETLTGWSHDDAVGQPLEAVFRIVKEDTREPVESPAARALREGTAVGLANHTVLIARDGSERAIDDSAAPIRDESGQVSGCVLIFRDFAVQRAAQRDKAQQLLAARMLAAIVETSDDAIVSKSLDGIIQTWNDAAERLFGYTAAQAVGRHISLIIPTERLAEEDRIIASLRAGERVDHFETERVRADGKRVLVSLTISPLRDEEGRVVGASKIVRDITRQREAEADRRNFATLVENIDDFIGICDLQGVPFFINRAGLEIVGLDSLEQARLVPMREFFFPEDRARILDEFLPRVIEKGYGEVEVRFRHFKSGAARWMLYKVLTLPDAEGKPFALATVSRDVTERRKLDDELRRLADDLSEADRRKDEFLATLAHELRNPLATISNTVQLLRRHESSSGRTDPTSEMLERQLRQMSRLVDDLLDVSRITRGKIELRTEPADLGPLLEQVAEAARTLHAGSPRELSVSLPAQRIQIEVDPTRLAQALGNLLSNAYKFTDSGGHISLTLEADGDSARIRVRDDGIGIAPEQLSRLFGLFTQLDTSLERSRQGLGIGLALARTLVEMHGGSLDARSEGLGRGSEFTVRLPIPRQAPAARPRASGVDAGRGAVGRRVLIVDDNEDSAESLALLLELDGHETHVARDGLDALAAAERLRPDAVLLDIGLPRLNGYEVARRLREQPWGRDILLLAMTGWGQDEDRQRSREAGFDAHMVKPVTPEFLARALAAAAPRAQKS